MVKCTRYVKRLQYSKNIQCSKKNSFIAFFLYFFSDIRSFFLEVSCLNNFIYLILSILSLFKQLFKKT